MGQKKINNLPNHWRSGLQFTMLLIDGQLQSQPLIVLSNINLLIYIKKKNS